MLTTDAAATAGIPTEDARPILAALWWHRARPVASKLGRPRSLGAAGAGERPFVRELGQRIHTIRHARRLTPDGIRDRTDIAPYLLRDIEAGDLPPSTLQLHRLAHAFAVPLPLLVDHRVTPLRVLRLLSGQSA